jgi:RNA-directed DNA polymerase
MKETKSQPITKRMVWEAYQQVRDNRGSAGIDGISIAQYESNLANNLYQLWNRLTSGSYFPPAVKQVEIPKGNGKTRKLGIPTVSDRVAQGVVKNYLEPKLEPLFHDNSYGFRPNRSAHDAIGEARKNCWKRDWVIDMDIKGFFDEINHSLMMKALERHTEERWVEMYIERWLKAPVLLPNGELQNRDKGTPQGGVISPLLANLFLHYSFDKWIEREFSHIRFERYADDIIVHCSSEKQAVYVLAQIRERLQNCGLQLHPEKTKIVYCRDENRRQPTSRPERFTFLGYEFKSRMCENSRNGTIFFNFTPAISTKANQAITKVLRELKIHSWTNTTMDDIVKVLNAKIRGWINYYGRFRKSEMQLVFRRLNERLCKWIRLKYKRLGISWRKARIVLQAIYQQQPKLFVHWQHGFKPC